MEMRQISFVEVQNAAVSNKIVPLRPLTNEQYFFWDLLIVCKPAEEWRNTSLLGLETLCKLYAAHDQEEERLMMEGALVIRMVKGDERVVINPRTAVLRNLWLQILRMSNYLQIAPSQIGQSANVVANSLLTTHDDDGLLA